MDMETARRILNALPGAAVLIDRSERVRLANAAARDLLGRNAEGRHFVTLIRQPAVLEAIERALESGTATNARYLVAAGSETAFRLTAAPLGSAERPDGILLSFEDISPEEQASQMRRDFVANVSHELRTPLTALLGFIETLRGAARDDAAARDRFLGVMEREASRMNRLVQDLLSLSRVETQERVRPAKAVDVIALIRAVMATLSPGAAEQGVTLVLQTDLPGAAVNGDSDQLTQAVQNLVENAIKYGGRDKTVTIAARIVEREPVLRARCLCVSVADQGEGVEAHHLPRLTERFYRVDNHRSRQMGGTGLGLAIVKHIVNRHRGRLKIASQPGQGTEFTMFLPLA
ncbi:ATP-binding protein [Brevirhabdus sp.]|uniref:ATP-binding protein n=1 Tax=Brevirhabdus sp. TaxID=2004514 RepID=UPI004058D2CC